MANIINAITSGAGGLSTTADASGTVNIQSNGTTVLSVTSSGVAVTGTLSSTGTTLSTPTMKNRIINGAMVVNQRGSTSSDVSAYAYGVDRFGAYETTSATSVTAAQSTTAPTGFINSLLYTVGTGGTATAAQQAYIRTKIEGLNVTDLGWGSASASTVTLSFWVRSSLTGTYCVYFKNSAQDRSYVSTYTISAANTWEQKTITVAGDTSGTWLKDNGIGIELGFDLGSGSNSNTTANTWAAGSFTNTSAQANLIGTSSATFYLTGVQLEVGSSATSFEWRPYGTELTLCQRYYQKTYNQSVAPGTASRPGLVQTIVVGQGGTDYSQVNLFVPMRTGPTISIWDGNANSNAFSAYAGGAWTDNTTSSITSANAGEMSWSVSYTGNPFSTGTRYMFHFSATAEL